MTEIFIFFIEKTEATLSEFCSKFPYSISLKDKYKWQDEAYNNLYDNSSDISQILYDPPSDFFYIVDINFFSNIFIDSKICSPEWYISTNPKSPVYPERVFKLTE